MNLLQNLFDFFIVYVLLRVIVGHWLAGKIEKSVGVLFSNTVRKQAIWEHYQARVLNQGHDNDNVLTCGQEKCAVFQTV